MLFLVRNVARTLPRTLPSTRYLYTAPIRRRYAVRMALLSGTIVGSLILPTMYSDAPNDISKRGDILPLTNAIRSYIVYSMCSIPFLVDHSPEILSTLTAIPVVKQMTEAFVRVSFFSQFVGGDTAEDVLPLLHRLRSENKGALFAYSVEADEDEASGKSVVIHEEPPYKRVVDEIIRAIDVAADFEDQFGKGRRPGSRRTWVAVKITALVPSTKSLINLSSHIINTRPSTSKLTAFPGRPHPSDLSVLHTHPSSQTSLTIDDILVLKELHGDLFKICTRAQERGVKVIIDAEYSWYQPAIDALTLSLMLRFNKLSRPRGLFFSSLKERENVQPLVYGTYQAYLRRTPEHLAASLTHARKRNYALGIKLVRGAYHPHEIAAHCKSHQTNTRLSISPDAEPPVWMTKSETDACYERCTRVLVDAVKADVTGGQRGRDGPKIGVLFGTHNWASCKNVLEGLVQAGLAKEEGGGVVRIGEDVTDRVCLAQLYGMSDALTNWLVEKTRSKDPFVIKYVPYGALPEVMPYLSRRAIENKSVLGAGGAVDERRRAWEEIWRRVRLV